MVGPAIDRHRITDDPIPLIAVTRSGAVTDRVDAVFTPADLLEAWLLGSDQPDNTAAPRRSKE